MAPPRPHRAGDGARRRDIRGPRGASSPGSPTVVIDERPSDLDRRLDAFERAWTLLESLRYPERGRPPLAAAAHVTAALLLAGIIGPDDEAPFPP